MLTDEEAIRAEVERQRNLSDRDAELNARLNLRESNVARAKEIASQVHGAARDDRDSRQDGLTARLLGMYERIQDAMLQHMTDERDTVREIKEGLARVEKQVAEFVKAFPDGD